MSTFSSVSVTRDPAAYAFRRAEISNYEPADTAPFNRPLWLEVKDAQGTYRLKFRCMRTPAGFISARTCSRLTVEVVGWRYA